jgi:hypothetical protein
MADQEIYKRSAADIQKRVVTITGANENLAYRVASTFAKLCEIADWSGAVQTKKDDEKQSGDDGDQGRVGDESRQGGNGERPVSNGLQLHQDIHIHLPATSDPAVYRAVFQAIKSELT